MRAFIAVELPKEAVREIVKIQKELEKAGLFSGKLVEKENLHLTLKFLGGVDDEKIEEARKRLREIKFRKFEGEIDEIGVFSEHFIRIIWLRINGKEILELQKEIDEKLAGLFDKGERFMSHLTIARPKKVADRKKLLDFLKKMKIEKVKFKVNSFELKKSELLPEGPVYTTIEKYNLG